MATIEDLLRKATTGIAPKRKPVQKKKSTLIGSSAGALDNHGNVIGAPRPARGNLRKFFEEQERASDREFDSVQKALAKSKLERAQRDRRIVETADLLKRTDGNGNESVQVRDIALALDLPEDVVEETLGRVWA
jgi:hypothetical protein